MSIEPISEAVVLAGGLGTRLNPLTKYRPKPLVPIGNYTMLDWNLFVLASNGIKKAVVVVNYLGDQIRKHIKNVSSKLHPDLEIVVPKVDSNGTADALRVVSDHVESDNFFVTMSDIVTNINLRQMGQFHIKKGGIGTISLKPLNKNPNQYGIILVNESSKIIKFLEKPSPEELYLTEMILQSTNSLNYRTSLINSGMYCFKRDILDILDEKANMIDFGYDVFPFLLKNHINIFGFKGDYYWRDCGRPKELLRTNVDVLNKGNLPYLPKGSEENGSWFADYQDFENILIEKPVAIGENVQIEPLTTIHLSSVDDNTIIGKECNIHKALIWENVKIGDNVRIKNSIISDNVKIGDNCAILDETIIPPGFKIPPNSIIRRGVLITELSDEEFIEYVM